MPELRLVVLALQDRLAYGPTFESADGGPFWRSGLVPDRRSRALLNQGEASRRLLVLAPVRSGPRRAGSPKPLKTSADSPAPDSRWANWERLDRSFEELKRALDRLNTRKK